MVLLAAKGDKDDHEYGMRIEVNHPGMILAIEPKPGEITNKWINPHSPDWNDKSAEWYKPVWCKAPCPPTFRIGSANRRFHWALLPVPRDYAPGSREYVMLVLLAPELKLSRGDVDFNFGVALNAQGEIGFRPSLSDTIRVELKERTDLPDPSKFDLLDWTEPNPPCGTPSR